MSMQSLYVGSYSPATEPGIHRLTFDPESGVLRRAGSTGGVQNPSFLAVHPQGRYLYAVSETGLASDGLRGSVHAFRVEHNGNRAQLAPLGGSPTWGDHPCHIGIDPGGQWLAVSNYGTGSVAILAIGEDGSLSEVVSMVEHEGSGVDPDRQSGPHAHCALFAPGERFLVAADLGTDRLKIHAFDRSTGLLTPHSEVATLPGAGPRHIAFHPDGSRLFAVNELDNSLTLYQWDGDIGALAWRQTLPTLPAGTGQNLAAGVAVSHDGGQVFVSNRGHDSLAVFTFDPESGLTSEMHLSCGGNWPRAFGCAPDGQMIVVANEHSNEVAVISVDDEAEGPGRTLARLPIPRPTSIAFAGGA